MRRKHKVGDCLYDPVDRVKGHTHLKKKKNGGRCNDGTAGSVGLQAAEAGIRRSRGM